MTHVGEVREKLRGRFSGTIREGVSLAGFTTFRIGGPAALLAIPAGIEDLHTLMRAVAESEPGLLVLGRGSNVLISDRGFHGVVVVMGKGLKRITRKGKDTVYVEGGCQLKELVNWTIEMGLGGLEDLAGIPGSVGGAVCMNAGAMGSSMGERVIRVRVMALVGREVLVKELDREDMGFTYRGCALGENEVVFEARLQLETADVSVLESRRRKVMAWRRENQPLRQPSAGSVFRNPQGVSAGELIDRCGLKGARVGGAMVSEKHANFIINLGGASANDVHALMMRIKNEVRRMEGVELKEEIRLVGEMGEGTI